MAQAATLVDDLAPLLGLTQCEEPGCDHLADGECSRCHDPLCDDHTHVEFTGGSVIGRRADGTYATTPVQAIPFCAACVAEMRAEAADEAGLYRDADADDIYGRIVEEVTR